MKFLQDALTDAGNVLLAMFMLAFLAAVGIGQAVATYYVYRTFVGEGMGGVVAFFYGVFGISVFREVGRDFLKDIGLGLFAWFLSVILGVIIIKILPDFPWAGMAIGAFFFVGFGIHIIEKNRPASPLQNQVLIGPVEESYEELKKQHGEERPTLSERFRSSNEVDKSDNQTESSYEELKRKYNNES